MIGEGKIHSIPPVRRGRGVVSCNSAKPRPDSCIHGPAILHCFPALSGNAILFHFNICACVRAVRVNSSVRQYHPCRLSPVTPGNNTTSVLVTTEIQKLPNHSIVQFLAQNHQAARELYKMAFTWMDRRSRGTKGPSPDDIDVTP